MYTWKCTLCNVTLPSNSNNTREPSDMYPCFEMYTNSVTLPSRSNHITVQERSYSNCHYSQGYESLSSQETEVCFNSKPSALHAFVQTLGEDVTWMLYWRCANIKSLALPENLSIYEKVTCYLSQLQRNRVCGVFPHDLWVCDSFPQLVSLRG